jgi:TetR/AcrR family transcriptional regulator
MARQLQASPEAAAAAAAATASAAAPVPRQRSQKTRDMILAGALAEFSQKGFDGARIDEIALRAGVNKNLLYHHFGNKDGLFSALLERTYDTIRARQNDLQLRSLDPVGGMRKLVVFTGKIWVQWPEFLRLLQSENLHRGRHARESSTIPTLYNPLLDTINDLLQRGAQLGVFRDDVDPVDLYISISSLTAHYLTHHHTFEAIFKRKMMTPERIRQRLEHAADMIERYLVAPVAAAKVPKAAIRPAPGRDASAGSPPPAVPSSPPARRRPSAPARRGRGTAPRRSRSCGRASASPPRAPRATAGTS